MTNTQTDVVKRDEIGLAQSQWQAIGAVTPSEFIMTRPGRGGKQFSYVETGYVIDLLNKTFNGMWDFTIDEQQIGNGQVWVKGKLTVKFPVYNKDGSIHSIESLSKTQYGGSDIKTSNGSTVDIADDLKAAGSDALKKCASLFGFAADIYWNKSKGGSPSSQARTPLDAKREWVASLIKSGKIDSKVDVRVLSDAGIEKMFTDYKATIGK